MMMNQAVQTPAIVLGVAIGSTVSCRDEDTGERAVGRRRRVRIERAGRLGSELSEERPLAHVAS
jgi:hypothetical protein